MKERNTRRDQESGFSLIELLIVVVILSILSSLSILYITASRRAANGASAIQSLRVMSQAEASFASGVGARKYATPQELFDEDLIDTGLARACFPTPTGTSKSGYTALPGEPKSGFFFDFTVPVLASDLDVPRYSILGRPFVDSTISRTGDRTFFVDQTGVIRASVGATIQATNSSQPID